MGGKSKPEKRRGVSGQNGLRNAKGQFLKGGPGGPGRGHRRERALAGQPGTPQGGPAGAGIACEGCEELRSRLELTRAELADERAGAVRQSREWAAALHALERFPDARRAVLDEVLRPAEEAEAERDAQAESPVPPGRGPGGPAAQWPAGGESAGAPGDPESQGQAAGRPMGAREQLERQGGRYGTGGVSPTGRRGRLWSDRDELLDPGSPQERGGGPYGDTPPWRGD